VSFKKECLLKKVFLKKVYLKKLSESGDDSIFPVREDHPPRVNIESSPLSDNFLEKLLFLKDNFFKYTFFLKRHFF